MKRFLLFLIVIEVLITNKYLTAQTLYVPNGTNGITNSSNTSVGIGTATPQAKLHITVENQDNLGLIIHSNSINTDNQQHFTGLSFDGDYGNGTGNCSQIRSYSNLYTNWGSTLTFHTTAVGSANNLVERMRINQNGYVGIGTSSPSSNLVVNGVGTVESQIITDVSANSRSIQTFTRGNSFWNIGMNIDMSNSDDFHFRYGNTNLLYAMTIKSTGNVLIGKTTQTNSTYKLDVAGKIRADEITVNTTGADFVFHPSYKLRSLSEIETYIKTHQHLPDIASASEMQEDGVSVSEMQTKLLQKIEELTLYTIDQNKKLADQGKDNAELKQKLTDQEKEIKALKELIVRKLNN